MADKFLEVMIDQVAKWMQQQKKVRVFRNHSEKPKYISATYLERDTKHVSFLDGVQNGVDGIFREACASMRVLVGRSTQGFGSYTLDIPEIPRKVSRLNWALESNFPEVIDKAFADYLTNVAKASLESRPIDQRKQFVHLSNDDVYEPVLEQRIKNPDIPTGLKRLILQWTDKVWVSSTYVQNTEASLSSSRTFRRFVDSQGRQIRDNRLVREIVLNVRLKHKKGFVADWSSVLRPTNWRQAYFMLERVLDEFDDDFEAFVESETIESGNYPAILDPYTTLTGIHEPFAAHLASAERWKEGRNTVWFNKLGKKILPEHVSIIDDPTVIPYEPKFDDEGCLVQRVVMVENGRFVQPLHTRNSAGFYRTRSNGHSRKEFFTDEETDYEPRIFNVELLTSNPTPDDELLELLKDYCRKNNKEFGLYVVKGSSGSDDADWVADDPASGRFIIEPLYAFKVYPDQEGLGEPVSNFVIVDSPYEFFKRIVALGSDVKTVYSACGDIRSGNVDVVERGPACFIKSINVQSKP